MKEFLSVIFRNSLARDYLIASMVLTILAMFAIQATSGLIDSTRSNIRVQTAHIEPRPDEIRNYQVSRSVLDDSVVTGSISKPGSGAKIILDPCTGQIKK